MSLCLRHAVWYRCRRDSPSSACCVMACALGVAEAEGTSQERSQSANALKNRRYSKSTFSAGASSPMMDWMISSPSRVARASLLLPCAQQ